MNYSIGTVFCKRFFYFWTFLLFNISFLGAVTISGFVFYSDSTPVAFAFVQNISKNSMSYSDESGYFDLQGNNEIGDSLLISRIGFHYKKIILDNFKSQQIQLISKNIDLESIIVEGVNSQNYLQQNNIVKIAKTSATQSINPQKIFSSIPGSYIKSYGGSAGISTLSMDGAPTRHTKILISGFDITNAQNGQVDLSQLPENFIENISYNPNNLSAFQNGSSEGSINISPWKDQSSVHYGVGSYGRENYGISLNLLRSRFSTTLLTGKSKDDGNYKGYNPITKKDETRTNNHLERDYISLKMNGVLTKSIFTRMLYLYSNQSRGVAGQIWSPTPESYRDDNFHLLGLKLGWASKVGAGFLQSTIRNSHDHYFSSPQFGYPFNSKHNVNTFRYKIAQNFNFSDRIKYSLSIQCNNDHLESNDTGDHLRISWIISNSLAYQIRKFKFTPAFQFNFSKELYAENTWNYTIEYLHGGQFFNSLNFHQGIFFHYPSFNDLFWKPGGNPDLKPEQTSNISLDFIFSIFNTKDLKIMMFNKTSENLIQWLPSQSFWQPKNVKNSFRRGIKTIYSFSRGNLTGFANYTFNINEDESTKKQLLYSPKHSAGLNLDYSQSNWQVHYQIHFTDERITRYSWPEDVMIDRVIEQTIGISYDYQFKYGNISNSIMVENLTNEQYETIQGYPEPGRVLKYRIQYYINKKGEKK